jgi:Pyruvate/2-oxoacid:ferredoxin oxidoreductase delta subunit
VLDSEGLISIAKFKTHQLTRITGPVKNQFGCVPGILKTEFHLKLPNPLDFAKMLVCIDLYIRPRLYIVDGIMAMEGNGPRGGTPVNMKVLLFSKDPLAAEAVMCRLIDLNPEFVPTMKPGKEWGLGTYLPEEIELVGDPIEPLINKSFKVVRAPVKAVTSSTSVSFIKNLVSPRPVIDPEKCNKCGTCVKVCPANPKAVDWHDGDRKKVPTYKYERCIRCFCCQEMCPDHAISVQTPFLGKLIR